MISNKIAEFIIRRAVAMHSIKQKDLVNWEPWVGCKPISEACNNCYYYVQHPSRFEKGSVQKTKDFDKPKSQILPGKLVATCFMTDFFIEEADEFRHEIWQIIKERDDLPFIILTKRIERVRQCLPGDWGDGYQNVILGCTIENQKRANQRLPVFAELSAKYKFISCVPLLEKIDLSAYLDRIKFVAVGGEFGKNARVCNYDWILDIRDQCIQNKATFWFKSSGSRLMQSNTIKNIHPLLQNSYAKKANINVLQIENLDVRRAFEQGGVVL
ncbi:MAG: phage Gp37/Gp68 family protein [Coriobacteriia bacterium]|nr:phage Gp37/Gp68 family protein [Coriobacteriia bacterium]MCL2750618.1 phage Gp37/Gp68 family protein [Coriobacteriia bacterium]